VRANPRVSLLAPKQLTPTNSAFVRYRRSTLELEVVAYKDIEPGAELSVSCE